MIAAFCAGSVAAADLALVISNGTYPGAPDDRDIAGRHRALVDAYREAGFAVSDRIDADRATMRRMLTTLEAEARAGDRLVVHFSGHAPGAGGEVYLAPVDMVADGQTGIAVDGVPLDLVLSLLARSPGQAALFLGLIRDDIDATDGTRPRVAASQQGVLMVSGGAAAVATAAERSFLAPGRGAAEALRSASGVEATGFVSDLTVLAPAKTTPPPSQRPVSAVIEEERWRAIRDRPTEAELRNFLASYPDGRFSAEARRRLLELNLASANPAETAEEALRLNREDRRRVQEQLTVLGYDTRGVDGIFGPGTRGAIRAWQKSERRPETGYLDRGQMDRLTVVAARRSAEIAAEEAERKRQRDLADQAFWRETGANGRAVDLRAYLSRYPEGLHAAEARRALDRIEADDRRRAQAAERADWDRATAANTVRAYRDFLDRWPRGTFADAARARIERLTEDEPDDRRDAANARIERGLGLNTASLALVEQRLKMLDYDVGVVDGQLDAQSRRAIRQFQRRQGMAVTGYLNSDLIRRLIVATSG